MSRVNTVLMLSGVLVTVMTSVSEADMRGQVVCGVPADEAVLLTWQNSEGSWSLRHTGAGR